MPAKTDEQMARLRESLRANEMFSYLDRDALPVVYNAMFDVHKAKGAVIIKQGKYTEWIIIYLRVVDFVFF